jgi:hypothetical protein
MKKKKRSKISNYYKEVLIIKRSDNVIKYTTSFYIYTQHRIYNHVATFIYFRSHSYIFVPDEEDRRRMRRRR